ncbi:MAG: UvrD-helicase domain-containing protein, partial [Leptospiraceae bacterium]|nr:UvrD-helicase domain-containing protein [Leptospiraceae bacterium]
MTGKTSKEVVTDIVSSDKHAFVEASAGTGKTTLLVELVTKIIENNKATIGEILCVTFTEKAASELKDRISQALRRSQNPLCQKASEAFSSNQIGTIHSFCLNALREHPLFRLSADTILPHGDEDLFEEARERVYRIDWSKLPKEQLAKFLAACEFGKKQHNEIQFDAKLKQKALWCFARDALPLDPIARSLEEVHDALTFQSWTIFRIVKTMQELARERNLLTYSLMVTRLAQLVEDEGFAEKLRCRYRYALVDEFQDTDPVQWKIFRTLFCQKGKTRLIVVGDPKQAIYKFRGADVFVYLKARDELKALNAYEGKLEKNFRNNQALLEFHNLLFENPKIIEYWQKAGIQYHKPYLARKDGKTQHADEAAVEIFYVKEKFTNALLPLYAHNAVARIVAFRKKRPTARCAVIALRHQSLRVFANALRAFGLEYSYYNEKPDFMRPEFLHLKVLLRSLLLPVGEGFAQAQATLFLKERSNKTDWYYRLHQFAHTGHLTELVAELAQDTTPLMLRLACGGDCADYFAWQNLLQVLLAATGQGIHDLPSLLEHIDYLEQNPNEELGTSILREDDAVTLITLHSAKGLDWDLVVVADGHNESGWKNFPFFHDEDKNAVVPVDLAAWEKECTKIKPEEEARLVQLNYFYVALTRARDKLILLHCRHNSNSEPSGTMAFFLSKVPFLSEWDPGKLPSGVRLLSLEKNMNVQQE